MPVSEIFGRILAAARRQINESVVETRRRIPSFDIETFSRFLQAGVDPVVTAVASVAPGRESAVAVAACDIALTLVAQTLVGPKARTKLVERTWGELAPLVALHVAEKPIEVLGALSNAALYLGSTQNLRGDEWLTHMTKLAREAQTVPALLALGKVLAWRSGASHFRKGALEAAEELPPALALAAVGSKSTMCWPDVRAKFLANPWWTPEKPSGGRPRQAISFGNFIGFGGCFAQPPVAKPGLDEFRIKSGDRYGLLVADCWGATFHSVAAEEFVATSLQSNTVVPRLRSGKLEFPDEIIEIDLPAEGLELVCNAHTALIISPYSYGMQLYPLQ